jgi:UDP-N-acetylmuramoylalanine--D-glutamate ligase
MRVAILGYGTEGQAALEYWNTDENHVTVCDQNQISLPAGVTGKMGGDYLKDLHAFDVLVRSPGIYPGEIAAANPDSPHILDKVTSVTNEFFKVCPSKNIIGVTGTKGKGTTSSLITALLEASGKTVHLGGNIGIAPLEMLKKGIQPNDWVVLELSSFQLIDLHHSPKIGVCLMVAPEHLNWHAEMEEYLVAKQQLFVHQTVHDLTVYNRASAYSRDVATVSPAPKITYEVPSLDAAPLESKGIYVNDSSIYVDNNLICKTTDVALLGRHNLENICAAIAATWQLIGQNASLVKKVLSTFKGLPHRLELVRTFKEIAYYDDSFGTTPETAIVAIQAFAQPKVVILGGSSKGASFENLAQVVASHNVRAAVLIGETSRDIEKALRAAGYETIVDGGESMASIVTTAQAQAKPGDIVLLSTGCASFDLFENYKDRAQQFQTVVKALK